MVPCCTGAGDGDWYKGIMRDGVDMALGGDGWANI
jgi:hypothetical protein